MIAITNRWQTTDKPSGIKKYLRNAKRLTTVNAVADPVQAIDALQAHSRKLNTATANSAATPPRIRSEKPPPNAIPVIATVTGSLEASPVIAMMAKKMIQDSQEQTSLRWRR